MTEAWRKVIGHPFYEVSDLGRIRRAVDAPGRFQGRLLRPQVRKRDGYVIVHICEHSRPMAIYLHRAVLETFVGPCPEGRQCAHDDGVRSHNWLSNLAWATPTENASHKRRHGTHREGAELPWAKLNPEKVIEIRRRYASGETQVALSAVFGVRQTKISEIVNRKIWRHVA